MAVPTAVAVNRGLWKMGSVSQAYFESKAVKETRCLISELCRQFYNLGWVSETGGSITMKVHGSCIPKAQPLIPMSSSGVQKERMQPVDIYVLSGDGSIISLPSPKPYPHKPPKCSDCAPLFMKATIISAFLKTIIWHCLIKPAYDMHDGGSVIHSHGMESCLVTMINSLSKEFRNEVYPKTTAVLVRHHGIHLWGDSWISAKTQAECYHYLFDAAIKLHHLGLDWSTPDHGPIQNCCVVLDIKGIKTPISFVTDVLFPYARDNVGRHLSATYNSAETQDDIKLLRSQVENDLKQGVLGAVPIPSEDAGKEEVIASLVANVEAIIKADRKITALKQLQSNELEGLVFDDVPEALEKCNALGIKVYIYSSGSRLAQRLIFGNTNYGDLRKYKRETRSYAEITESLGVDKPRLQKLQVVFGGCNIHPARKRSSSGEPWIQDYQLFPGDLIEVWYFCNNNGLPCICNK
ncbi:putative bifunctional methylthioribulose-1-phosphate dehydratase/enolase-phosphatase E1 [Gossypium australe]|uniref:Putative bifunctional methylthioribulose-1-phosphate dehydratase/enolase-phosphatase E1 n=1 Tax=Gossypium australe TaxID=47621 RepID=A0A5B6X1F3_9ROSI|nr:putative bifunctional methylthioribulose-1-phosphate dehydratase/enolase-phosphatase E1 [Gossypium australe]